MRWLLDYLARRWRPADSDLAQAYRATFSSIDGQRVLQHLLDTVYFSVYKGTDPHEANAHNARRSVVHEVLINMDIAENPQKYILPVPPKMEEP